MLLFQFLYDLLVSNCMETAYGWKLNDYMKRARDAFEVSSIFSLSLFFPSLFC